ncbi:MAG TPA: glycosyltransferase family 4 protein [Allosphingosinicella sp.]|nr:glycosyltransferase family 4 protein [Allosphingosinicella sp.]
MSLSFCCWQPLLTAHQAHTLKALADRVGGRLAAISSRREDEERKAQGWAPNDDSVIEPEILPAGGWRRRIREILDEDPDRIHIFGSPFERARTNYALLRALKAGRRVYLLAEPFSRVGVGYLSDSRPMLSAIKARLRPFVYRVYGKLLRQRIAGVFAISPAAVEQFAGMGVRGPRVHPFGYFVPGDAKATAEAPEHAGLRIAYLGSFIARKGVRTLLDAMASPAVQATGATLDLFGPAGLDTGSSDASSYRGQLPFGQVQQTLSGYDLLVVPSLYDGWAVVVNEAVMAGVPVLASDSVGAAAMLRKWGCGDTFEAGDADDLARKLAGLAADPPVLARYRAATATLAPLLEPGVAAGYLLACIEADLAGRPAPATPWY